MDIPKLLAAYIISQGAHTGGHFNEANSQGVPISLDAKNLIEDWEVKSKRLDPEKVKSSPYRDFILSNEQIENDNNRKRASIHGAGFSMQDKVRDLINDPETKKDVSLMNAAIKAAYLLGLPQKLSSEITSSKNNDIGGMKNASGNRYVKGLIAASGLMDLYKTNHPEGNSSIQFTTVNGAPGLVFNRKF